MFKSKLVGWITASTLLCVAGVAIACRLQDGAGYLTDGLPVALASTDETPAPPVPSTESTPLPAPVIDTVPTPVESTPPPLPQAGEVPPPPPPSAAVPVVVDKPEEKTTPLPTTPVETSAIPPPKPKVGESVSEPVRVAIPDQAPVATKLEADPAVTPVAPDSEPVPVKIEATRPAPAVVPVPATIKQVDPRNYWAEQGDTLRDIARKRLGSEERWMEIEKLNPELRARTMVPAGTLVRLPGNFEAAPVAPMGGQAESEFVVPETRSTVKPLPVIRSKPEFGKSETPLIGTFECKIDDKGCVVLPKEIREQLGRCDNVYLTPGPDQCLWLVSESGRMRVRQRVEKAAIDDDEVLAFRRLYFSQTRKVGVDAASCLSVPEDFCKFAGFTGTVVIIGSDDHFEVWDAARWQRYSREKGSTPKTPRGNED